MAQNRNRINYNGIFHFLSFLEELSIAVDSLDLTMKDTTILLSQKYQLTAYDASYLNLCLYHDIPMATLDKKLKKVVLSSGSSIFQP